MSARLYKLLYRIRRVEEEIARVYPTDCIRSPVHLSIGQEAVSVGVCEALGPRDVVFGTYRGHALYLARGGDLRQMIAELYGKATGCTRGKGGSMHLIARERGVMGTSAVVGTTIANAAGYAYALCFRRESLSNNPSPPPPPRSGEGEQAGLSPLSASGRRVEKRGCHTPSEPAIVASFFGDGATEEGVFAE